MEKATGRQYMAIYLASGCEIRHLDINKEMAHSLISKHHDGICIKDDVIKLGGIPKKNAITIKNEKKPVRKNNFSNIHNEAHESGMEKAKECKPIPMVVSEHSNPLDDNSPITAQYVVNGGVCGFAYPIVKDSRTAFAKWLLENDLGFYDNYEKGIMVRVPLEFGQSLEIKSAYSYGYCKVLDKYLIKNFVYERLD